MPNPPRRPFAGLTRNTFLLAFASLFSDIATEMLYPVLPVFLAQQLKAGGGVIGLVEGAATATQNIAQGFSGSISDRLARRKPLAIAGYLLAAVSKPLIGISSAWQGVLGARFLDRLGSGIRAAPRDALIAASDDRHRGRAFGLEGIGDNAGACLGPLLAVVLLSVLHVPMRLIFLLAVIPGLLALAMILLVRESPRPAPSRHPQPVRLRGLPPAYWKYLAATGLFGLGNSANAFLILRTRDLGASLTVTILIYAAFNLVAALVSYPAGALSDRVGRKSLLLASAAIFAAVYLGFALARSEVVVALLFGLYGVHQGVLRTVGKAMAADLSPERLRASGVGWYSAVVGLTGMAASLAAGLLWDRVGHTAVFFYGAAFASAGGLALLAMLPADAKAQSSKA
jgi:MFS family permease